MIESEITEGQIRSLFTGRHNYETRTPWLTQKLKEKDEGFNKPIKEFLTEELKDIGDERILDIGSGVFSETYLPDNRIKQTTKTDFVEIGESSGQNIVNVNADDLSSIFDGESFGAVIMKQVYTHLKNPAQSLEEVHRVLKKQGLFILIDWERDENSSPEKQISEYIKEMVTDFDSDQMMEDFGKFGFEPVKKQILLKKDALAVPYDVSLTAIVGRKK